MATRNIGASQGMSRQSMATSGNVVKTRQLVRSSLYIYILVSFACPPKCVALSLWLHFASLEVLPDEDSYWRIRPRFFIVTTCILYLCHLAEKRLTTPVTAQLATCAAFCEPVGYRELTADDERAGGGDEGVGELARWFVSPSCSLCSSTLIEGRCVCCCEQRRCVLTSVGLWPRAKFWVRKVSKKLDSRGSEQTVLMSSRGYFDLCLSHCG